MHSGIQALLNMIGATSLNENQVFKINQHKNTETKPCKTSSQQESFYSTNISGPIVQPVLNLNSIFEGSSLKTKLGLVFPLNPVIFRQFFF